MFCPFSDEPNSDRMKYIQNREKEIREQILSTVICVIAPRLKDFNELLRNPPNVSIYIYVHLYIYNIKFIIDSINF